MGLRSRPVSEQTVARSHAETLSDRRLLPGRQHALNLMVRSRVELSFAYPFLASPCHSLIAVYWSSAKRRFNAHRGRRVYLSRTIHRADLTNLDSHLSGEAVYVFSIPSGEVGVGIKYREALIWSPT